MKLGDQMNKIAENRKKIQEAMATMRKNLDKKGSEMTMGFGDEMKENMKVRKTLTKIPELDILTKGGICRGRITELWGRESSGKTTMSLVIASQFHKMFPDQYVVYSNNEHTFDPVWAKTNGLDPDDPRFIINNAECLEDSLNFCIAMADTKAISCMIIDSITGLSSRSEIKDKKGVQRDIDDNTIAVIPRTLSQFFRMAVGKIAKSKMALLVTNQVRTQGIGGVFVHDGTAGGNALKHYKSLSLEVKRGVKADAPMGPDNKTIIGYNMVAKVTKDKTGALEGDSAHIPFLNGQGPVNPYAVINSAIQRGIINRAGASYTYKDHKVVGKAKLEPYFVENGLIDTIQNEIYKINGIMEDPNGENGSSKKVK